MVLCDTSLACAVQYCPPCRDFDSPREDRKINHGSNFMLVFHTACSPTQLLITKAKSLTFPAPTFSSPVCSFFQPLGANINTEYYHTQ